MARWKASSVLMMPALKRFKKEVLQQELRPDWRLEIEAMIPSHGSSNLQVTMPDMPEILETTNEFGKRQSYSKRGDT
ncbi:Hypothetical protein NTJ_11040 [Nesidiocoris tenuis]|uniref:Uncharacterized protein n=1 Tax=Nesidiocoris tenuis TaxID=355587 RepID=A0ABN7B1C7_9HEMI|nr:Hypothetical protein NTJ_11040 [Nesidiocoris tenuis]